ncbi:HDIG domain-containing protein [Pseudomonas arsenicoxydans]|uniref:HDIG domain-containing protein n=1 Tax=Pseudomonas arsenicoxydans TaxID=702115 RepID=A0A1H0P3P9_9PSED|nr:HD-GYP domain-containing protein [Pseudomonas arsenicoxydans]SDO99581.1 HDIG domain-containing protein [Pseudomonas arsenicoxydans]
MLKYIAVSELRLGMYIHEFCGSGIEHPLWKNGFFLQDLHDLQRIYDSKVLDLWINISRGVDIESRSVDEPPPFAAPQSALDQKAKVVTYFDQEVSLALKLCARSKAAVEKMFNDLRMGRVTENPQVTELVGEIFDSVSRHPDALISLARLKTSDEYTYMHSVAVCALMIALAREMNLSPDLVREAGLAGLMHDVGKSMIPIAILNKPGKLLDGEFETMRRHPVAGAHMLQGNPHFTPQVLDVCLHHHERFDGSGYPHKLVGSQISLLARMGAICDVYDAVTSDRPYKKAWGPADSIHRMAEWQGHFDSNIFHAFVRCVGIYPVGSLVRLESGRIGVVSEQNKNALLTPKVIVFFSTLSKKSIPQAIVDLAILVGQDRIVRRESPERWKFKDIDQLWSGLSSVKKSHFD